MTVATALRQGTSLLEEACVPAPRLTAEVLLSHALRRGRTYLYAHPEAELPELAWLHYGRYLHERLNGKPTQYITHEQEFYGRPFRVTPDVLIPRPETEHVVETALSLGLARTARALDVGCGSGAIAVTLACEGFSHVTAADLSGAALAVARGNAERLGARVEFVQADLCAPFAPGAFDLIASNPPYVPDADRASLQREVRDFEPPLALYGGADGLEAYRRLIPQAAGALAPGGWLVLELGYRALDPVREMLDGAWCDAAVHADLAGLPRVLAVRYTP